VKGEVLGSKVLARPIRIEYPGAFYHVFSRGNQKQRIFFSDEDRCHFINCLRNAYRKFGVIIHTYCLMPNHFHLFLETPLANLSRAMHFLIANYTSYINRKHDRHGHLFQGRFRSVLVDAVGYAKELSRYIHLNPVRSGIVERPEQFVWSSYGYYRGTADPERWLGTSVVLSLFGQKAQSTNRAYEEFVEDGIGKDHATLIRDSVKKGILGSEEFIENIKRTYLGDALEREDRDRPQLRRLRSKPDLTRIRDICEKAFGPANRFMIPTAIFLSHGCTSSKLSEIGEFFSLSVSGVSSVCTRTRKAMARNEALSRAVREIQKEIEK
jgi:putative transposase